MKHKTMFRYLKIIFFLLVSFVFTSQTSYCQDKIHLTMESAISRALSKNNQIRSSHFALQRAKWDKKYAWTLLFPTVSFNTRFTRIDDETYLLRDFSRYFRDTPSIPGMPDLNIDIPQIVFQESYVTSFDVNMPLFNTAILNGISIASANEEMAAHMNESTRDNIIFQVISNYLNALRNKEILQLQRDYLDLSRLNFEKAERLYNAGRYSKTEALRWKVDFQQQKSVVVNNESVLRTSMIILQRLVNTNMQEEINIDDRIPQGLITESENLTRLSDEEIIAKVQLDDAELIKANAALAAAKSTEQASKRLYRNSYTSYLPNLSLNYSYGWRENNTLALDDYSPKTLMLNLSVPIFSGFQNYSNTKAAYYEYKQSQEQFYDQIKNARFVLNETVNKIINLKTQRELSLANVEYNEHNYKTVEQQKEKGLVSNIDFIDAKLNLQDAKLNDISTHYDFISAMVELYYMLGGLKKIL